MTPRAELPIESSGGDQVANPTTFGTTIITMPLTPDFAGSPTYTERTYTI